MPDAPDTLETPETPTAMVPAKPRRPLDRTGSQPTAQRLARCSSVETAEPPRIDPRA